jgi:hypothetical protein
MCFESELVQSFCSFLSSAKEHAPLPQMQKEQELEDSQIRKQQHGRQRQSKTTISSTLSAPSCSS